MNWKTWLQGLAAAAIGGAVTAAAQTTANRLGSKDAPPVTGGNIAVTAGVGALATGIAYLLHSPFQQPAPPTGDVKSEPVL